MILLACFLAGAFPCAKDTVLLAKRREVAATNTQQYPYK